MWRLLVFALSLNGCIYQNEQAEVMAHGWRAVYKHDAEGEALDGSIDALIEGIRQGFDVRVGWGWEKQLGDSLVRLEHMAEPVFLTIIQEEYVSIVTDGHPLLASYLDVNNQTFGTDGNLWQCILTTKGEFNAQVRSPSGDLIKDWPQRQKMTWFLEYPSTRSGKIDPLFSN